MLTIGSTPGPGALHLTQGVVRVVVVVGGGQCYIFYYLYTHTYIHIYIYTHTYIRILTFVSLCLS